MPFPSWQTVWFKEQRIVWQKPKSPSLLVF